MQSVPIVISREKCYINGQPISKKTESYPATTMELTILIVSVAISAQLMLQFPSEVTAHPPTPVCRQPAICVARSPQVCGRTAEGKCRRFKNICDLIKVNGKVTPGPKQKWRHTQEKDCRRVRKVGARHSNWCFQQCPRRPVKCPRTPKIKQICVRSRNQRACKIVANRCQLLNINCHTRPRFNWRQTDKRRCGNMQLGDKDMPCRTLPIVAATTTERTTTTQATTTQTTTQQPTTTQAITTSTATTTRITTTTKEPKDHDTTTRR